MKAISWRATYLIVRGTSWEGILVPWMWGICGKSRGVSVRPFDALLVSDVKVARDIESMS